MVETWFFLQSPAGSAALNMAVDEALLRTAGKLGRPLLRVYAWEQPAVSFGYFQKFPAAVKLPAVRRPTGGGVVHHGADTTYTVIVPPGQALYTMKTAEAYRALHKAVAAALGTERSRRSATLHAVAVSSPRGQYECFEKPVAGDVVAAGKKLAGAAQRRTKWGLLHQGSIAAKISARRLQAAFRETLGIEFEPYHLTEEERALAESLVREKYSTDAWNRRLR
jgi:lipoate-protein ligase A